MVKKNKQEAWSTCYLLMTRVMLAYNKHKEYLKEAKISLVLRIKNKK